MTKKMRRVAIYLRVSTGEQTTENQRRELDAVAEAAGWQITQIYEDAGISGAKGRDKRPAFDQLCKDATGRKFDLIAAWSVDRLGRSLQDLVAFLGELNALGIDLYLKQQGLDTTTPSGRAMFQMLGVFSEFERAMIAERVKSGLARARANGKRLGRPRVVTTAKSDQIFHLRADGASIRNIAKAVGISATRVHGVLAEAQRQA